MSSSRSGPRSGSNALSKAEMRHPQLSSTVGCLSGINFRDWVQVARPPTIKRLRDGTQIDITMITRRRALRKRRVNGCYDKQASIIHHNIISIKRAKGFEYQHAFCWLRCHVLWCASLVPWERQTKATRFDLDSAPKCPRTSFVLS